MLTQALAGQIKMESVLCVKCYVTQEKLRNEKVTKGEKKEFKTRTQTKQEIAANKHLERTMLA